MEVYVQALVTGISNGSIYALVGLGFAIILLASQVFNLSQGEFLMLGGMTASFMVMNVGLPLPVACIIAVLIVMVVGVILERLLIHPLISTNPWKESPIVILILVTMAASFVFQGVAMLLWGSEPREIPYFLGVKIVNFLGSSISTQAILIMIVTGVILALLFIFFQRTTQGKAMIASAENPVMASLLGINVRLIVMVSFALSAGLGAVAGLLIVPITRMTPFDGPWFLTKGLIATLVGGGEKISGPVVGGFVIGIVEAIAWLLLPGGFGILKNTFALLLLIIILVIKPAGILGNNKAA